MLGYIVLAQERAAFGPLTTTPETYGLYRVATVNREGLVRVDGNQYSVPVGHLGQAVDVRILRDVIRISRDGVPLAEHARLTGAGQRQRDPDHYTSALTIGPGRGWSSTVTVWARSARRSPRLRERDQPAPPARPR